MDALRGSAARLVFFAYHRLRHLERKLRHGPVPAALCLGLPLHRLHVSRANVFCSSPLRRQRPRNAPRYFRRARFLIYLFYLPASLDFGSQVGIWDQFLLSLILLNSRKQFFSFRDGARKCETKPPYSLS